MRGHPNNSAVIFRANDEMVAAARDKARREGRSLSSLMRDALRCELREAA